MKTQAAESLAALAGKYLTVVLGDEAYGIAVLKVREIFRHQKITPLPSMPEYVKGVINLRGQVIPVADLRLRFGFAAVDADRNCIVLVRIEREGATDLYVGLIVDGVMDVANITVDQISPAPELGGQIDTAYLLGIARVNDHVRMLLDIDRLFAAETVEAVAEQGVSTS